jgi:hypothetical protein
MQGASMNRGNASNRKTGLILATVALGFFLAIVLEYWLAK